MHRARTILIAGTASHVGKSTVASGLCRWLADRGVDVAPFKAQNMSNNARAVPRTTEEGPPFGEIGVSQFVQARAARIPPSTDMNPVLLKPRGGGESQLIVDGVAIDHVEASRYYDDRYETARKAAIDAHHRLAKTHDVIVAEGAGSIAEINLQDRDLANVETARVADAEIVLVADIERGGVFASIVGTLELLPSDLRDRVVGVVITKFRGDRSLLAPGVAAVEDRTNVPVLGVIPYDDPGLPEEDSLSLPPAGDRSTVGGNDGVAAEHSVTIAVPRFPHASNVTDLQPLADLPGVRVAYVPLTDDLGDADAIVLSGTKNTVADLLALRAGRMEERIVTFDGPIVGVCGGYQLLGDRLTNVHAETGTPTELPGDELEGLGLLPIVTRFGTDKRVRPVRMHLSGTGPLAGFEGDVSGYEIHSGRTRLRRGDEDTDAPKREIGMPVSIDGDASVRYGAASGNVFGTYLHGLFETDGVRRAFASAVFETAGRCRPDLETELQTADPYEKTAQLLAAHVDLRSIGHER
ncbi:MAG: cobyric acid synthase [Halobacteriota archaeon]